MTAISGPLVLTLGSVVLAVVVLVVTRRAAAGRIGPHAYVGIRTRATQRTPRAWREAHRAALPLTRAAAYGGPPLAALGVVVALVSDTPEPGAGFWVSLAAVLGQASVLLGAVLIAQRAARRAP